MSPDYDPDENDVRGEQSISKTSRRGALAALGLGGLAMLGSGSAAGNIAGGPDSDEIAHLARPVYEGPESDLPDPGVAGRRYTVTDEGGVYPQYTELRDTGGEWQPINLGVGSLDADSVSTEEAHIGERNLTLGEDAGTDRDDVTVLGGGAAYDHQDTEDPDDHNDGEVVVVGTDAFSDTGWSVAIGHGAETRLDPDGSGDSAVAIGRRAETVGHSNIAIGRHAEAIETYRATALGRGAKANGPHSVGIGYHWDEGGSFSSSSIAIGRASLSNTSSSIAIGSESSCDGLAGREIAIGRGATSNADDTGRTVALGSSATADYDFATAVGSESYAGSRESIAIGRSASVAEDPSAREAIAIGLNAFAGNSGNTVIGPDAEASENSGNTALGTSAVSDGNRSVALGHTSEVLNDSRAGIAIGEGSTVTGDDGIAIGRSAAAEEGEMVISIGGTQVFEMDDNGDLRIAGEITENASL